MSWDDRAFLTGLQRLVDRIDDGAKREEERLAKLAVDEARPPVDTGELRQSKVVRKGQDGTEYGWTADHAGYVEYGTEDTPAQPFARRAGLNVASKLKSPI